VPPLRDAKSGCRLWGCLLHGVPTAGNPVLLHAMLARSLCEIGVLPLISQLTKQHLL